MSTSKEEALDNLIEHLKECVKADAVIAADGNADEIVQSMLDAGWTWDGKVEVVSGKRIRVLSPPPGIYIGRTLPMKDEE